MSYSDYLDPDRHLGFANDEFGDLCEDIKAELRKQNDGRWEWEQIDYCFTGKDADLEPWGDQGVEVVRCDDDGVHCCAHIGKTFVGDDVCLNLQPEIENDDEAWEKAREAYLDQAQEIVAGCAVAVEFTVPWENDDDDPDLDALTKAIIAEAEKALAPLEQDLAGADEALEMLAGWKTYDENGDLVHCPEGQPGPEAAWMQAA